MGETFDLEEFLKPGGYMLDSLESVSDNDNSEEISEGNYSEEDCGDSSEDSE